MKKTFLFLLLLSFTSTFSQINLSNLKGNWIKVKTYMKDGSKLLSNFENDSSFVEYSINAKQFCINSNPINRASKTCMDYTLLNNALKVSEYTSFVIEKLTNDSLVLSENIKNTTDDKLRRTYLVREEILNLKFKELNSGNKNLKATKLYTPKAISSLVNDLNKAFKGNYSNFNLIGKLKIFPNEKKVKTSITYSTQKDSTHIKTVEKVINNSFHNWELTDFKIYESIEIPFVVESVKTKHIRVIFIHYFMYNLDQLNKRRGVKIEDIRESSNLFNLGIQSYQQKEYTKAIEYFTKSYDLNPKNIDALYNKVVVYSESGDKESACKELIKISEMGQVKAKELLKTYCQ